MINNLLWTLDFLFVKPFAIRDSTDASVTRHLHFGSNNILFLIITDRYEEIISHKYSIQWDNKFEHYTFNSVVGAMSIFEVIWISLYSRMNIEAGAITHFVFLKVWYINLSSIAYDMQMFKFQELPVWVVLLYSFILIAYARCFCAMLLSNVFHFATWKNYRTIVSMMVSLLTVLMVKWFWCKRLSMDEWN